MRCLRCGGVMLEEGRWDNERQNYVGTGMYRCINCGLEVKK